MWVWFEIMEATKISCLEIFDLNGICVLQSKPQTTISINLNKLPFKFDKILNISNVLLYLEQIIFFFFVFVWLAESLLIVFRQWVFVFLVVFAVFREIICNKRSRNIKRMTKGVREKNSESERGKREAEKSMKQLETSYKSKFQMEIIRICVCI